MYRIHVFAGPNGSGKSSLATRSEITGVYINADDIKAKRSCSAMDAAKEAERICYQLVGRGIDFTFETVLSSAYKLELLKHAKESGYNIVATYVTTRDPSINLERVQNRVKHGGHDVPAEKIVSRYYKSLENLPLLIQLAGKTLIYDNSGRTIDLICETDGDKAIIHPSEYWTRDDIVEILLHQDKV